MIALIMTIPSIGGIIGSFCVPFFAKKFGKRNVLMWSMIIQGIGLIVMYLAPFDNMKMVLTGDVIFGLFNVGFPMSLSMVADSVDYMELRQEYVQMVLHMQHMDLQQRLVMQLWSIWNSDYECIWICSKCTADSTGTERYQLYSEPSSCNSVFLAAAMCLLWKMTDKEADDIRTQLRENIMYK